MVSSGRHYTWVGTIVLKEGHCEFTLCCAWCNRRDIYVFAVRMKNTASGWWVLACSMCGGKWWCELCP
jgi:hypothetical protein